MKTSSGPSTAPREWTIYLTRHDEPVRQPGEKEAERFGFHPVAVVERASLDRVVEERESLRLELQAAEQGRVKDNEYLIAQREQLREALEAIKVLPGGEPRGTGCDRIYKLNGHERAVAIASAALQSGVGGRHED